MQSSVVKKGTSALCAVLITFSVGYGLLRVTLLKLMVSDSCNDHQYIIHERVVNSSTLISYFDLLLIACCSANAVVLKSSNPPIPGPLVAPSGAYIYMCTVMCVSVACTYMYMYA